MSTTVNSVHEHPRTKNKVFFSFTWSYDGTTIDWTGKILLAAGGTHTLGGGEIINVPHDAVEKAVNEEIKKLIDHMDMDELEAD